MKHTQALVFDLIVVNALKLLMFKEFKSFVEESFTVLIN